MGENRPSRVKADINIELTVNDTVKREWEGIYNIHALYMHMYSIYYVHVYTLEEEGEGGRRNRAGLVDEG